MILRPRRPKCYESLCEDTIQGRFLGGGASTEFTLGEHEGIERINILS
jgi:hypothetical protein